MNLSVFWFRRDLRLHDNTALNRALDSGLPVMPIFIFDTNILEDLINNDARVNFIYERLLEINKKLNAWGSSIKVYQGRPLDIWKELISAQRVTQVFFNKDYEPYALERDQQILKLLNGQDIAVHAYKDHVVFEEDEIIKGNGEPYVKFSPYKYTWLEKLNKEAVETRKAIPHQSFQKSDFPFPALSSLGFRESTIKVKKYDLSQLDQYESARDFPGSDSTSYLGPHLRFGTVSIREVISNLKRNHHVYLSELIWREFFIQILYHFPMVVDRNFNAKYDDILWRNNKEEFQRWCNGSTGYPLVDAGMRQLNETGYMHNRVRMVTASFLCKHLLIDWRWGEAYFAGKLLDYELASNNGNWQWTAGTGCDAAPYFRVFNPTEQMKKFDREMEYVRRWVPEYGTASYPQPIVEHHFARNRAIDAFRKGIVG
jgi:deoxyribodipyrimidine photo-lyase